jgi:hypothetical protein
MKTTFIRPAARVAPGARPAAESPEREAAPVADAAATAATVTATMSESVFAVSDLIVVPGVDAIGAVTLPRSAIEKVELALTPC